MTWLALRLLGLRNALGRAFAWATASATRMLAIALCVALLGGIWAYKGWSKDHDALKAEKMGRASDNATNRKSIDGLQASIATQNAAVQALGDASAVKQKQSAKIVADAVERGKVNEAAALKIEQERKTWPRGGPVCRTGGAVMDARSEL